MLSGVRVDDFTFPFLGRVDLGEFGGPLTLLGLVAVMNVVNFSDGVDGLAAGVCAIAAVGFAVIAFDLHEDAAGVLAACIAGSALGFLVHNFHPASVFMGDSGSNLLGLLLGAVIVEGSLKTNALIALVVPLVILAVPFLDTGFVVAKRIKYRRPVYQGDSNHFHHRFHRMGFSQRKTVLYLYAWSTMMTGIAVALRFVPYSESNGHLNVGWAAVMGGLLLLALAASVYLVYVLEILKLRRLRAWQLRREDPDTSEHQIDSQLEEDLETGEFPALRDVSGVSRTAGSRRASCRVDARPDVRPQEVSRRHDEYAASLSCSRRRDVPCRGQQLPPASSCQVRTSPHSGSWAAPSNLNDWSRSHAFPDPPELRPCRERRAARATPTRARDPRARAPGAGGVSPPRRDRGPA